MPIFRRIPALLTISIVAVSLASATSAYGAGWVSLGTANPAGTDASNPQSVIDASGNITVAWYIGDNVSVATRPAGGSFGQPTLLSTNGSAPRVGTAANGDVIIAWRTVGTPGGLAYTIRPAGSNSFSSPQVVSGANLTADLPVLAVDSSGRAFVVWNDSTTSALGYAFREPGGSFGPAATVTGATGATEFTLAASTAGSAYVIWGNSGNLNARSINSVGALGSLVSDFSGVAAATGASAGLDQSGNVTVAWDNGATNDVNVIRIVGVTPGSIIPLTGSPVTPTDIQATTTAVGSSHIAWTNTAANPDVVQARRITAGGSLGVFQNQVSPQGNAAQLTHASGNSDGAALAIWDVTSQPGVQAAAAPNAQPFGGATQLGATNSSASADGYSYIAASGNGVANWSSSSVPDATNVNGYDNSDPTLSNVNVPSSGTQLRSVSFSATPFDIFALNGPVSWNFGDGKTASGNSVPHTYAKPGSFTVTASVSDTVGNTVSQKKTIKVASAPSAVATFTSKSLKLARNGRISVKLRCGATAWTTCRGTVYLKSASKVRGASSSAVRKRILTIGQRSYTLGKGKSATVKVLAKRKARKVIRRLRKVRTRVSVTGRTGAGNMTIKRKTVTLRR